MKIVVLFLLIGVTQTFALDSYAQTKRISLNLKNATINRILDEIEDQSEFYFMFDGTIIDVYQRKSINCENQSITTILDQLLKDTHIVYEISDRQIVLFREQDSEVGQQKTISGKVTDSGGSPLPGVTVVIKGTTHGTVTNADGEYSISNVPEDAVFVFSFVGMKTQEIPVAGKVSINVVMAEETFGIDEVVAIGYGTMRKSDLTGSVASVKSDKIQEMRTLSADQALSGRIAGVQVTQQSSAPGGGVSVIIRGGNSVNGDNDPLYVIDGFPVTSNSAARSAGSSGYVSPNSLSSINPNDIESIEILKDASATAIYGARGANGVIIITTKKGKTGAPRITFDSYYGVQAVAKKLDVMNAEQYAIFANEAADQNGFLPTFSDPASLGEGTDWQDKVFTTAPIQNYQVGISGGNGKTTYYVSGNYFSQDGIIENSGYQRYSARMNLETEIGSRIKVGTTFTGSRSINNQMSTEEGNGGATGVVRAALYFHPYLDIFNEDGVYTMLPNDAAVNSSFPSDNPVALLNETKNNITGNRILTNVYGQIELAKGLYFRTSLGADLEDQVYESYYTRKVSLGMGSNGAASTRNMHYLSFLNENTLTYSTDFSGGHQITVLAGYTRQKEEVKNQNMSSSHFLNDILQNDGLGSGNPPGGHGAGASHTQWQLASWIGRVNYNFKDKYLFTLSARYDGSSRLGKNQRWGFFPSGALAWNVSNEGFMKDVEYIQNLKVRVSYGVTGNTSIGSYRSIPSLRTDSYTFDDNRVLGYYLSKLPNADLRWESTDQFDVGLDVGLFRGRLWLTADYYVKNTNDLLLNVTLPYSTGYDSALKNTGQVQNKGIELALGGIVLKSPLNWETNLNWSMNRNELVDLGESAPFPEGSIAGATYVDEGHALGEFWGYVSNGIFKDQAEVDASAQPDARPGDLRYVDTNKDGSFDASDRTYMGNPYPDFIFGWSNKFRYKAFSLTAFIMGTVGNDVFNITDARRSVLSSSTDLNHSLDRFNNRWTTTHTDATQPRAGWTAGLWAIDSYIEDGSFVRLKTLQFGYDIPLRNNKQIKNAFVYISGQNLFTITGYSGYNPEVNSASGSNIVQGIDMGAYPLAKTYLLGIKVEF